MTRARRRSAVVALAAALWCSVGTGSAGAASDPDALTLRLSDLPHGFLVGDDSGCGLTIGEEGTPRALIELARQHPHRACAMQYERLWAAPGERPAPPLVESTVFAFERPEGALAGFDAARALIEYTIGVSGESLEQRPVSVPIGESTALFRADDAVVRGRARRPGVAVLWRTGSVLALMFVGGRGGAAGEEQALALARVQQGRVAAPTPLSPEENDDREVALDDPRLGVPVYWLGKEFDPPGAPPPLALERAFGPISPGGGPGWRAEVDYDARVTIGIWRPRAFARFKRTRLSRHFRSQRCASSERVGSPAGRAVIHAVYATPPKRCGRRAPDRYFADVFVDGAVVTVNLPHCLLCVQREQGRRDPYNTPAGIRTVIDAIHLRRA